MDCDYNITALGTSASAQTTINAAIAVLPSTGGKIILREGTYNITGNITVNKTNVTLEGMGDSTVLKRMANFINGVVLISGEYCRLENCYIDGNKSSYSTTSNHGIYISNAYNTITNNKSYNSAGSGIFIYS